MKPVSFFIPAPTKPMLSNRPFKNWGYKQAVVRQWQDATMNAATAAGVSYVPLPARCIYAVQRPTNILYDPANWMPTVKAAIDGLVHTWVLEEDNKDLLQGPDPRHHPVKGELGFWLIFTDWEER